MISDLEYKTSMNSNQGPQYQKKFLCKNPRAQLSSFFLELRLRASKDDKNFIFLMFFQNIAKKVILKGHFPIFIKLPQLRYFGSVCILTYFGISKNFHL